LEIFTNFQLVQKFDFPGSRDEGDQDFKGQFDVSRGFCDGWNSRSLQ